jgi:hypothetical protein
MKLPKHSRNLTIPFLHAKLVCSAVKLRIFIPLILLMIAAQAAPPVAITSPRAGDIVRGQVIITGTTDIPNFLSAQLDFAYASDQAGNWFTLQTFSQPALDSALHTWDTTLITDGSYILRLQVFLTDGTTQEVTVPITIQNDSTPPTPTALPPTSTPESIFSGQIPTPFLLAASPTPTDVPRPTPTALPMNPISLNQTEIYASLARGALVILGLFAFAGIILRFRRT